MPPKGRRAIGPALDTVRFALDLPADLHQALTELAVRERRSLAQQMIVMLERGIHQSEPVTWDQLASFIQHALEANQGESAFKRP